MDQFHPTYVTIDEIQALIICLKKFHPEFQLLAYFLSI